MVGSRLPQNDLPQAIPNGLTIQSSALWVWPEAGSECHESMPMMAMVRAAAPTPIVVPKATFRQVCAGRGLVGGHGRLGCERHRELLSLTTV